MNTFVVWPVGVGRCRQVWNQKTRERWAWITTMPLSWVNYFPHKNKTEKHQNSFPHHTFFPCHLSLHRLSKSLLFPVWVMDQQHLGCVRNADSPISHPRFTEGKPEQIPGDVCTSITAYLSKSSWFPHTCLRSLWVCMW